MGRNGKKAGWVEDLIRERDSLSEEEIFRRRTYNNIYDKLDESNGHTEENEWDIELMIREGLKNGSLTEEDALEFREEIMSRIKLEAYR